MSWAKRLLLEEQARAKEPTLDELFEEALARAEEKDARDERRRAERRARLRLVVNND